MQSWILLPDGITLDNFNLPFEAMYNMYYCLNTDYSEYLVFNSSFYNHLLYPKDLSKPDRLVWKTIATITLNPMF